MSVVIVEETWKLWQRTTNICNNNFEYYVRDRSYTENKFREPHDAFDWKMFIDFTYSASGMNIYMSTSGIIRFKTKRGSRLKPCNN